MTLSRMGRTLMFQFVPHTSLQGPVDKLLPRQLPKLTHVRLGIRPHSFSGRFRRGGPLYIGPKHRQSPLEKRLREERLPDGG